MSNLPIGANEDSTAPFNLETREFTLEFNEIFEGYIEVSADYSVEQMISFKESLKSEILDLIENKFDLTKI